MNIARTLQHLFIVSLAVLSACSVAHAPPKDMFAPVSGVTVASEGFEKAERLLQKQAYSKALAIYRNYLRRYPGGPLVDTALMKSGTTYMAMGDNNQARRTFQRLISNHPRSVFVEDARFNVIVTYYNEGDYRDAVRYARSALGLVDSPYHRCRIHDLMGYVYSAGKQFKDAVKSYVDAYEIASKQRRPEILSKVKEIISYLKEKDLNLLLDMYSDRVPGGYLRLQLAREYAADDRIEPATKILSDLTSLFPDHDELETASALIDELTSRSLVDPFSIGCILPLSGRYGTFGNRALTGIELALDRFNTQLYVNPIQLIIKDSKGDPKKAAKAVEDLVLTDGVAGIIGPMITSESAAIKAQTLRVPIIVLTQKPGIPELGDYVFRNFLTSSSQIKTIVDYAVDELGIDKFAILYPVERYGISFMNRFWDELIHRGAEVVGVESYAPEQTDFSDAIKKLAGLYYPRPEEPVEEDMWNELQEATNLSSLALAPSDHTASPQGQMPQDDQEEPEPIVDFEAVFIPDSFEKIGLIAPQLSYHDVTDVLLLGTNLWHSDKLIEMAGSFVQGAIVPHGFFVDSPAPRVRDYVKDYEETFNRPPAYLESQAYDAAWILFQAVNQPEVQSRRTLKMALSEVKNFPGLTGLTSFDESGDVKKELYLLKVKRGRFVQIRP